MSASESDIENEIQEKNLNAPRLTPRMISEVISNTQYYIFPETMVTVCCLTLKNGFNVIGESACVSSANFDKDIGESIAYENARNKIWALEGYLLKQAMYDNI